MISRRDFLQAAAVLGSTNYVWGVIPEVIARAAGIDPANGSTFHDAEHVVILMQENRSFDHTYGSLSGVRGFRDPRPHLQPDGTPVWFQPEGSGGFIPPFRLDIEGSNVTWIGGTSHSWHDQIDARNGGQYNNWIHAKQRDDRFPMTMGFFTREDIPFYYALADAFTVCDQAFCSSLTGTTPNRLHLWTGTIREDSKHPARVLNDDTDYPVEANWTTFPERLEQAGVSWRIYQNELSIDNGLVDEHGAWLTNFTDNPIEWFSQYKVRFLESRRRYVREQAEAQTKQLAEAEAKLAAGGLTRDDQKRVSDQVAELKKQLAAAKAEVDTYTDQAWSALSAHEKSLHENAFCTNTGDPNYRDLIEHNYMDGDTPRKIGVPRGDVLHRFRQDVETGKLPAVSWLVAPERFSDHPGSAWFGAWYLSEAMHILTKDPEVFKKTVFILCYDENDGYFDHVPPFIAPHPGQPETGKTSTGIDTTPEISDAHGRNHSIGLGFRCPMVIVSPWTRGGVVNSQVCDHTSVIMFVETWLAGKGKHVKETNISEWRRTICGDLTSAFRPFHDDQVLDPKPLDRDAYVERIHKASFKKRPVPADALHSADLDHFAISAFQERGTRPSCALPYRLEANLQPVESGVHLRLETGHGVGCAFNAYSYGHKFASRAYAIKAGGVLEDTFESVGDSHVRVDGPNGFLRELKSAGTASIRTDVRTRGKDLLLTVQNLLATSLEVTVSGISYGESPESISLPAGQSKQIHLSTQAGKGWYDYSVSSGNTSYRFAGRVETGDWGTTDPAIS